MTDIRKLDVVEREQAVIRYLRTLDQPLAGATVSQIYRSLTVDGTSLLRTGEPVRDNVSQPAYYKTLQRLQSAGVIEAVGGREDVQRWALTNRMHADTAETLDSLRELTETLRPTEAIAELLAAREYVGQAQDDVLRRAATALRTVDPRALVTAMIESLVEVYNSDADLLDEGGGDSRHRKRLAAQRRHLETLCHRGLGLTRAAVRLPLGGALEQPDVTAHDVTAVIDPDELREQLAYRVFGETAISEVSKHNESAPPDWRGSLIAGSDGSTYSSVLQIDAAPSLVDVGGAEVLTFNNSVVYVHEPEGTRPLRSALYSVPPTRSAIDSPGNTGMVMAPFMYRDEGLDEGEYEHMAKCATDVVQWRADERVFRGHARSLGPAEEIPAPRVHFRDGTVTLQERESHHYERMDSYGAMVREGVRLSHDILAHIRDRATPPVFAGAVKTSQLNLFGDIVNWFIAHGSPAAGVDPIDPGWDSARASRLADNEVMTALLASLDGLARPDCFFTSFAVARPFYALTDMFRCDHDSPDAWAAKFEQRRLRHDRDDITDSHWSRVTDVRDDPYVRMMQRADYVLFYVGHSNGRPAPITPRYEFVESLRELGASEADARVRRNVELIVAALAEVRFTLDRDHNYLSQRVLTKIVPSVVYRAHESCRALGRALERELKSLVLANLARRRRFNSPVKPDVALTPIALDVYLDNVHPAIAPAAAGSGDDEPGSGGTDNGGPDDRDGRRD